MKLDGIKNNNLVNKTITDTNNKYFINRIKSNSSVKMINFQLNYIELHNANLHNNTKIMFKM